MGSEAWRETFVNVDGKFVPGPEATVSVLDRSFVYGDGVFEGIGIVDDRIVLLDEHVDRLYDSAKRTGIEIDLPRSEVRERIVETARKNEMSEGYLRPLVSRGSGPLGIHNTDRIEGPTVVVIPQLDRAPRFEDLDPQAVRISGVTQSSPDSLDPRVKSNNYMLNILAVQEVAGTDADTSILLDGDGNVTEAAAANVFVVDGDHLKTPPERSILVGTTRNAVLRVTEGTDLTPSVETLTPYDLFTADEAFLTGSLGGISPVVRVNDTPVGEGESEGAVGPWTDRLASALRDHLVASGTPVE
jgi:branched-chain amino acid aminotransferase